MSALDLVDHVIYAAPDLAGGCDAIEAALGVRPVIGGRHPAFGTHNALLSLGPRTYLEVMARDPGLPAPAAGVLFGLDGIETARVLTWVLRAEDLERRAERARRAGVTLGAVQDGGRVRPDGSRVSWRLTDPAPFPEGGVVPFLIAWGETPHPAGTAPLAGRLRGLELRHPEPGRIAAALDVLGVVAGDHLVVRAGRAPGVEVSIDVGGTTVRLA